MKTSCHSSKTRLFAPLVLFSFILLLFVDKADGAPPTGFAVEQVLTDLEQPMSMRFMPDERMVVIQKKGLVRIADVFSIPTVDAIYMDLGNNSHPDGINAGNERGVLDIAFDPDFENDPWVYVLYTPALGTNGPAKMRVSRFPHIENAGGVTSRGDMANEEVLWEDSEGYDSCCHFGGGLDFGPDGNLWFTTGDHFQGAYAATLTRAGGAVHRITKTGGIPADNPYIDGPGPNIDSIVAYGLRNPFRARWDLDSNRFFIGEVGGNVQTIAWEDLHVISYDPVSNRIIDADFGTASDNDVFDGINLGWPTTEGLPPYNDFPAADIDSVGEPLYAYPHDGNTAAITGGVVNRDFQFPAEYDGAYFFADSTRDFIRYLKFNPDGSLIPNPNPDPINSLNPDNLSYSFDLDPIGRVVALEMGPEGALYFVNFTDAGGAFGQNNPTVAGSIGRYIFDGGNARPVIDVFSSNVTQGLSPLPIDFQIEATDPEGSPLTYFVEFGDGSDSGAAQILPASSSTLVSHTYDEDGLYEVTLYVSDGSRTAVQRLEIQVGTPPVVSSLVSVNPRAGSQDDMFRFGDTITFNAVASDAEDGAMGAANFTWNVLFVRPGNVHPAFGPEDNLASVDFEIPVQGQGFRGNVFYRCFLTVTDSSGLSTTETVDIFPEKVNITLDTDPSGIFIQVDGNLAEQTPFVLDTLVNFPHQMSVPPSQCINGSRYEFTTWSNGGTDVPLAYPAPTSDVSLTANFTNAGPCSEAPTDGLVLRLKGSQGVVINSNNEVVLWQDLTSNNNNLFPLGEPTLLPGALNGESVVRFDGIDDALFTTVVTNMPLGSTDRSIFLLARYNRDIPGRGWGGITYGERNPNQAFGLALTHNGTLGLQGWGEANDYESSPAINGLDRWLNQGVIYSGGSFAHYDNGSIVGSGQHIFDTGQDGIWVGEELGGGRNIDMEIAEILVYDRAVSELERQLIEAYFEETYQVDVSRGAFPVVEIETPQQGQTFSSDQMPVTLTAAASDQEDGDLSSLIMWSSSVDGSLGLGSSVAVTLTPGVHTITVTVEDSSQLEVSSEVSILVADSGDGSVVTDGLVLQLEADLNVGMQEGATVGAWLDQSGLGNDLIADGDPQLVLNATPSGLPSIDFDGSGDKLERIDDGEPISGLPTGNSNRTMFLVAKYDGASAWAGAAYGNGVSNEAFGLVSNTQNGNLTLQGWGGGNDYQSADVGIGAGWLVQSVVHETGVSQLFTNGFDAGEFLHNFNTGLDKIVLGEEISGLGFADVEIAAVLIYDRALPAGERLLVEGYLQTKYLIPPSNELVFINTPNQGSSFYQGAPVGFLSSLSDFAPQGSSVTWSSDVDGVLGTGLSLSTSALSLGQHTISAELYDDQGTLLEVTEVSLSIIPPNSAPTLVIGGPLEGALFTPGANVNFAAGAYDSQDGDLSSSISWVSDLDGLLGTGSAVSVVLSPGTHSVTATVQDSSSLIATDSISIVVSNISSGTLVENGLVLQLESDNGVTVSAGTNQVTDWIDQTNSGNSLQAIGVPTLLSGATPAGLPAIHLNGNSEKLERIHTDSPLVGFPTSNDDRSVFIVARYNSAGAWGGVTYGNGAVNQAFGIGVRNLGGQLILQGWGGGNDYVSDQSGVGAGWLTQSAILSGGNTILYKGGQEIGQFSHVFNTVLEKLVIGEEISGGGFIGMDIAAVLVYDRAVSEAERSQIESYLQTKFLVPVIEDEDPVLRIAAPTDGSVFDDNESVTLIATATNVQDVSELTFIATQDAYTQDGSNRNNTNLRAENSVRERIVYLQFDLTSLTVAPVSAVASLSLTESVDVSGGAVTLKLFAADSNSWNENTITSANAPAKGILVDTFMGAVTDGLEVEFDLSSVVSGPGIYSFILEMEGPTSSSDDVAFFSKEDITGTPPSIQLLIPDPSQSIQWESDLDGILGIGGVFAVPNLSQGQHTITAQLNIGGTPEVILSDAISLTITDLQLDGVPVPDGLVVHLESTDGVQLAAGGGIIDIWEDASSSGNDLIAVGDPEVILGETPTGQPAIRLDGNGDKLERLQTTDPLTGLPAGNADRTMFFVTNYRSTNAWAGLAYGQGSANKAFGVIATSGNNSRLALQGWGGNNDLISSSPGVGEGWLIQSAVLNGGQATLYRNGGQVGQFVHTYNTVLSEFVIGEEIAGAGFAELDVAAVLIYDRALTSQQRVAVESYLQEKYLENTGVVSLIGNSPIIEPNVLGPVVVEAHSNSSYDPGAMLIDAEDGMRPISSSSPVSCAVPGEFMLLYEGVDADGNQAAPTSVSVIVVDTTPAEIVLPQMRTLVHMLGHPFTDPGANAVDNVDGVVKVTSSTSVDPMTVGLYQLTYDYVDSSGNVSATAILPVEVRDFTVDKISVEPSPDLSNGLVILFDSLPGFNYSVETSLDCENWTSIGTVLGSGDQIEFTHPDILSTEERFFYRVKVVTDTE